MGKYLGMYIGPGVLPETNWESPSRKFEERVSQIASSGLPAALIPYQFVSKAVSVLGYIGQLLGPPAKFKAFELRMAAKVFGFATNSVSTNEIYNLNFYGGPSLSRPSLHLHSCRVRACLKTFTGFVNMHNKLAHEYVDATFFNKLFPGASVPEGWNTTALCTNLWNMYQGNVSDDDFPELGNIVCKHRQLCRTNPRHGSGLQKKVAKDLRECVPNSWVTLQRRRFSTLGIPPTFSLPCDLPKYLIRTSKGLPPQVRMIALKTWCNSWATTERYHEEVQLECVFGCGGSDNLAHYLICDVLWTLLIGILDPRISILCPDVLPGLLSAHRACYHNAGKPSLIFLAIAFKVYHAIRRDYSHLVTSAFEQNDFVEVLNTCIDLIQFFRKDFPSLLNSRGGSNNNGAQDQANYVKNVFYINGPFLVGSGSDFEATQPPNSSVEAFSVT